VILLSVGNADVVVMAETKFARHRNYASFPCGFLNEPSESFTDPPKKAPGTASAVPSRLKRLCKLRLVDLSG
jgi:hypothetical protein